MPLDADCSNQKESEVANQASRMYSPARTWAALEKAADGVYKKYRAATGASSSRSRSRTTNNNRSRNQYVPQSGNDYQRIRARYGKKITPVRRNKKLLRHTLQRSTFSMASYGAWNRGEGNVKLNSHQFGGGGIETPIHLYDITCVPEWRNDEYIYPFLANYLQSTSATDSAQLNWRYRDTPTGVGGEITNKDFPQGSATEHVEDWMANRPNLPLHVSFVASCHFTNELCCRW
jgi:hypothetical protein